MVKKPRQRAWGGAGARLLVTLIGSSCGGQVVEEPPPQAKVVVVQAPPRPHKVRVQRTVEVVAEPQPSSPSNVTPAQMQVVQAAPQAAAIGDSKAGISGAMAPQNGSLPEFCGGPRARLALPASEVAACQRAAAMTVEEARAFSSPHWTGPPESVPRDALLRNLSNRFCGNIVAIRLDHAAPGQSGGDGEVCYNFGLALVGPALTPSDAARMFDLSCKLGFSSACKRPEMSAAKVADAKLEQRIDSDRQRSQQQHQERAAQQEQQAAQAQQQEVGALQDRCKKGDNAACVFFQSAAQCQRGLSDGCDSAGNAYFGGAGGARDIKRATGYWLQACQIQAPRCAGYGIKLTGAGNGQAADQFFDTGCKGDAEQCGMIGMYYLKGSGVPMNASKGRDYIKRGCDAGSATSCQLLRTAR